MRFAARTSAWPLPSGQPGRQWLQGQGPCTVTVNVYTQVSDAKALQALKRLGRQLGS
jgi:hypothetical protein